MNEGAKRLQVHQRLPASRDTKQRRRVAGRERVNLANGVVLGGGRFGYRIALHGIERIAQAFSFFDGGDPASDQPLEHRRRKVELVAQVLHARFASHRVYGLKRSSLSRCATASCV